MRWACNQRPFAAVLQSLHLDTPLLELQNTKKLCGTKNNSMHAAVGIHFGPKIQRPKNKKIKIPTKPVAISEDLEHKTVLGAKAMHWACTPALSTIEGWAKHLSHASNLAPGHASILPCMKSALHALGAAHKQGRLLCVLTPSSPQLQQGPLKILA